MPVLTCVKLKGLPSVDTEIANATAMSNGKRKLFTDFEGAPLTKYGVFTTIYSAIAYLNLLPRTQPISETLEISDTETFTEIKFDPWDPPRTTAPYFEVDGALDMVVKIPKFMYANTALRAGQFVWELDDDPVALGDFSVIRPGIGDVKTKALLSTLGSNVAASSAPIAGTNVTLGLCEGDDPLSGDCGLVEYSQS